MATTTRRNLLRIGTTAAAYAAGATIVTGGVALASQAKGAAPTGVSPGMAEALANLRTVERAANHHEETVFDPIRTRWLAAKNAVPHHVVEPSANWTGSPSFWSTDNPTAIGLAETLVSSNPRTSRRGDVVRARKLIAADYRRSRAITRIGKASGIDAAHEECDRYSDLLVAAEQAVCVHPAANLSDLDAKLAVYRERDLGGEGGKLDLLTADVRRLLAQEGR